MSELNIVHNGSALNPVHRSIKANRRLNGRDLLRFKLEQRGSGDPGLDVGDEIGLYLGSTFTDPNLLFAGTVDRISQTDENLQPGSQHYRTFQYEVADFNQVTDRFLVAESYSSQTLGAIVTDIVTTYLSGESVTTNNVTTGPTIERAVFPYVSVRDVFDELSERTGYIWWIDATKDLHFVNRTSNDAPFDLTSSNQPFQSLTVERNRSQYRNRQLVRAGQDLTDQRTESFDGDGQTRTFVTGFPVGEAPTIDVDGTSKTVGIRGVDQGKDFYWQKESNQITQDDGDAPLVSGDTLNITYRGLFPIMAQANDSAAIDERKAKEGGSGIYEHIVDKPQINDRDLAIDHAEGLLRRYGSIDKIVTYKTDYRAAGLGLQPGQLQTIDLSAWGLSGEFLVDTVQISDRGDFGPRYKVKALSGEQIGGWVEFFRRLANQGKTFTIRENEVLIKMRRLTDGLALTDSINAASYSTPLSDAMALTDNITTETNTIFTIGDTLDSGKVIG